MNDLIDRQAALDAVERHYCDSRRIREAIVDLPSAQPKTRLSEEDTTFDCISRQAAVGEISRFAGYLDDDMIMRIQMGLNRLKRLPFAQPDIIACGDCKHWINHDRRCGFWNHGVRIIDWCSRAERRENEQT